MVETRPPERRGDPNVAVLLTWFLPGAGHLYLGKVGKGVAALLLVEGLYAAGWLLAQGRTFEFLDPELRGPLATLLTPEAGNLGAMLYHLRSSGFGAEEPLPYPPWIALGSMLSALAGILNLFVCVSAHLDARASPSVERPRPHPVLALGCAWLVPGLGHWIQGRRLRGTIVCLLLLFLFFGGTWLAEGTNLSRERHFYYWSGQFLLGAPALATELLSGRPPVAGELPFVDVGLLYACMAGLLNVLAMLDVYGVAERRWIRGPTPGPDEARAEVLADRFESRETGEVPV